MNRGSGAFNELGVEAFSGVGLGQYEPGAEMRARAELAQVVDEYMDSLAKDYLQNGASPKKAVAYRRALRQAGSSACERARIEDRFKDVNGHFALAQLTLEELNAALSDAEDQLGRDLRLFAEMRGPHRFREMIKE